MKKFISVLILLILLPWINATAKSTSFQDSPRIVNIINFIRQIEPRDNNITENVLYDKLVSKWNWRIPNIYCTYCSEKSNLIIELCQN